jgi:hypothetical protein
MTDMPTGDQPPQEQSPSTDAIAPTQEPGRRRFIRRATVTVAGFAASANALQSQAQSAGDPGARRGPGTPLGADGARSPHVDLKRLCGGGPGEPERACDIFSNNSKTPFQSPFGHALARPCHT